MHSHFIFKNYAGLMSIMNSHNTNENNLCLIHLLHRSQTSCHVFWCTTFKFNTNANETVHFRGKCLQCKIAKNCVTSSHKGTEWLQKRSNIPHASYRLLLLCFLCHFVAQKLQSPFTCIALKSLFCTIYWSILEDLEIYFGHTAFCCGLLGKKN